MPLHLCLAVLCFSVSLCDSVLFLCGCRSLFPSFVSLPLLPLFFFPVLPSRHLGSVCSFFLNSRPFSCLFLSLFLPGNAVVVARTCLCACACCLACACVFFVFLHKTCLFHILLPSVSPSCCTPVPPPFLFPLYRGYHRPFFCLAYATSL